MKKKKIIILCGFLGSGKTTLLRHLLNQYAHYKVGVLLNDFGEIPVDGTLIRNAEVPDEAILEIGGGSIFCACLKESFVKALLHLATSPAELIFIEASGMADPAGMHLLLNNAHLESDFEHLCTICAFDPIKSVKLSHVLEVIPRQIRASDLVLLTKGDITSEKEKSAAKAYLKSINKDVGIIEEKSDINILSVCEEHRESFHIGSLNTKDNRPESFTISQIAVPPEQLLETLKENGKILRVKGYIKCGRKNYYISDTGRGFEVREAETALAPLTIICMRGTLKEVRDAFFIKGLIQR